MMKKFLTCLAIVGFGLALTTSQAFAIDSSVLLGALEIHFQNIDAASLYTTTTPTQDNVADSFALITVTDINRISDNASVWTQNVGVDTLTGIFYGLDDTSAVVVPLPTLTIDYIESVGGYIEIYQNTGSVNPLGGAVPAFTDLNPFTDVWNATTSDLYLKLAVIDGSYSSTASIFNAGYVTGSSSAYLRVVGGSAMELFDSNMYSDIYSGADMMLYDAFDSRFLDNETRAMGWDVGSTGDVTGSTVPEPASMILMGLGLLGAARLRRKA